MKKRWPHVTAAVLALAVGAGPAAAAPATDNCAAPLPQDKFEAGGGKLVVLRSPDLALPDSILKSCRGRAVFNFLVEPDGSVAWRLGRDPVGPNFFEVQDAASHPAQLGQTLECHRILRARLAAMRFRPPRLRGKPVCVAVGRQWLSAKGHELLPWQPSQ